MISKSSLLSEANSLPHRLADIRASPATAIVYIRYIHTIYTPIYTVKQKSKNLEIMKDRAVAR